MVIVRARFSDLLFPFKRDECGWVRHRLARLGFCEHRTKLITAEVMLEEINQELDDLIEASKRPIFNVKED